MEFLKNSGRRDEGKKSANVEEKALPSSPRRESLSAGDPPLSTVRISIADMMALHVRTAGTQKAVLPEFLYQGLPTRAVALMATIPYGTFSVSIPHRDSSGIGYPIRKSPPPDADGFVISYARQPNGRYEAVRVMLQGKTFDIVEFRNVACRWVKEHEGRLGPVPGRYAYFAPDRKRWGVILRDSGYTPLDPLQIASGIDRVLQDREGLLSADLVARIPVWRGDKQPRGATLPVFTQVELAADPVPGPRSSWIPFVEYRNARNLQSRPPASVVPDFLEWLKLLATESGFENFVFRPGMFFGDRVEWWGNQSRRRTEHEGLDFVEGSKPGAGICAIPEGTKVRSITSGEVVAILDDFLDKTVVVRHSGITNVHGAVFYTLYSHIHPILVPGPVAKSRILGIVGRSTGVRAPAHLHMSGAWIPPDIHPNQLRMDHIDPAFAPVVLVDFNELIQGSSREPAGSKDAEIRI
jgi:hypothetical protein